MLKYRYAMQKGFSILELMLVIAIVAVILVFSFRQYTVYKQSTEIALFQRSLTQVVQALNDYYYLNCNKSNVTDVQISDLQEAGLLGTNLYNPWGQFFVKIENTVTGGNDTPYYVLQVGATIAVPSKPAYSLALANFLRGALNADGIAGFGSTVLTWTRMPTYITDDVGSHQWVMNHGLGENIMPGRYMTSVQTGMNSQFWIMTNGLQMFSRQQQLKNSTGSVCPN